MRISSSFIYQTGLTTLGSQQSDLLHLYRQIGSGQRMVTPADDPLAASQTINLAQSKSLNLRYAENRAVALRDLATEEDALESLTLLLQDVRTRLVQAGNGTLSNADRTTLAGVLTETRHTLLGLANTTDGNGQYLFSGSQGQQPAYVTRPSGEIQYAGDALQRQIQADQTRRISAGDVGSDVFERAQPGTLAYGSRAAAQNQGTGVFSNPHVADVSAGNSASHYRFEIAFTASGYQVTVTDLQADPAVHVDGPTDFPLSAETEELDLGFGTRARLSGEPQPGDRFEVSPLQHENPNVFATLADAADALAQTSQQDPAAMARLRNVLNGALQRLDTTYDNVLTVRASVGARMNELSALDGSGDQRDLGYSQALSRLEDLDYYEATMQLNLRRMALEGAALAFQTIQDLSLFNRGGR